MPHLSARRAAVMQTKAKGILPDTCTIQKIGLVSDGLGGKTKGWSTLATNVPCLLGAQETVQRDPSLGVSEPISVTPIKMGYDAPLTSDCRVLHGSNTYEVWGLVDDLSLNLFKKAQLVRINNTPT